MNRQQWLRKSGTLSRFKIRYRLKPAPLRFSRNKTGNIHASEEWLVSNNCKPVKMPVAKGNSRRRKGAA